MMVLNDDRSKPLGKTNTNHMTGVLRYDYDNNVRMSMGRTSSNNYNNTLKTLANDYGYRTTRQGDNNRSSSLIVNSLIDIVEP